MKSNVAKSKNKMKQQSKKEKTIDEKIENNSNTLVCEVAEILNKKDWEIRLNPYYVDIVSDKSREIDLIAKKNFIVLPNQKILNLSFYLIIECKKVYLNNDKCGDVVFWFDKIADEQIYTKINKYCSLDFGDHNSAHTNIKTKHHYFAESKVAKMHAIVKNSSGKNDDGDFVYKALDQVANSLIYFQQTKNILAMFEKNKDLPHNINIFYPIIIFDSIDRVYSKDIHNIPETAKKIDESFLYFLDYSFNTKTNKSEREKIFVDILSKDKFGFLLDKIEVDEKELFGLRFIETFEIE